MISFIKDLYKLFIDSDTFQKGAALAYYTVFSLIPILVIVISVLGIIFGDEAVSGQLFSQLEGALGPEAADQIQELLKQQKINNNSFLTAMIGVGTLVLSASGMLNQIHITFNKIWKIKPKPKNSILDYILKRLTSFGLLLLLFFVLILSTTLSSHLVNDNPNIGGDNYFVFIYEHLGSLFVTSILFTIIFKYLGDADVHWKPAIYSGIFTAVMFLIGKIIIGFIIGRNDLSSTFGSASMIALVMLWAYYISQIIFLGAAFMKIISDRLGLDVEPDDDAVEYVEKEIVDDEETKKS